MHEQSANKDAGSVTSTTLQFVSNVKVGSTLLVASRVGATGRTITVSDDVNGAYTAGPNIAQTTDGHQAYLHSFVNTAAGRPIVTYAISGVAATIRLAVLEYSQVAALDQSNQNQGTGTNATCTDTTTAPVELLIGAATHNNGAAAVWTAASSGGTWTKRQEFGGTGSCVLVEDILISTAGTYDHNPVCGAGNGNWTSLLMTFPTNVARPLPNPLPIMANGRI